MQKWESVGIRARVQGNEDYENWTPFGECGRRRWFGIKGLKSSPIVNGIRSLDRYKCGVEDYNTTENVVLKR